MPLSSADTAFRAFVFLVLAYGLLGVRAIHAQIVYRERFAYHDSLPYSLKQYDATIFRQGTGPLGDDLGTVTIPEGILYMNSQTAYMFLSDRELYTPSGRVVGLFLVKVGSDTLYRKILIRYNSKGHYLDQGLTSIDQEYVDKNVRHRYNGADGLTFVRFCTPPHFDPKTHVYKHVMEMFSASSEERFLVGHAFIFLRKGYLHLELEPMADETCQEAARLLRETTERIHINPSEVYTAWSLFDAHSGFTAEWALFGTGYHVRPTIHLLNLVYLFKKRIFIGLLMFLWASLFILFYKKERLH